MKIRANLSPLETEVLKVWLSGIRKPSEIAKILKANPNSVRVALHRLRKKGVISNIEAFTELKRAVIMARIALLDGNIGKAIQYISLAERYLKVLERTYEILNPEKVRI